MESSLNADSDSAGWGVNLRIYIFNKLPGKDGASGPWAHFELQGYSGPRGSIFNT